MKPSQGKCRYAESPCRSIVDDCREIVDHQSRPQRRCDLEPTPFSVGEEGSGPDPRWDLVEPNGLQASGAFKNGNYRHILSTIAKSCLIPPWPQLIENGRLSFPRQPKYHANAVILWKRPVLAIHRVQSSCLKLSCDWVETGGVGEMMACRVLNQTLLGFRFPSKHNKNREIHLPGE